MKVCTKCKVQKKLTEFSKAKQNKDGYLGKCKPCEKESSKEYYEKNKEKIIQRAKKYYKKNLEKIKIYRENKKERDRDISKKYEKKKQKWKTEKSKEYQIRYRENNKEKLKKQNNHRYLKNRSKEVENRLRNVKKIEEERKYLFNIGKKECSKCKKIKDINNFSAIKSNIDGVQRVCKCCDKEYRYKYSGKENQRKIKKIIDKRNYLFSIGIKECSFCKKDKKIFEFNKNKSKIFGLNSQCKNCVKINKNLDYYRKYYNNRRKTEPLFKLKCTLRSRTIQAFKTKGYRKNTKTQEMLGVDWEVAKKNLERQFTEGMSWNNHGEWHIDHIIPLASANTEEELIKLCHYKNLQPLWAIDNLKKGSKIYSRKKLY